MTSKTAQHTSVYDYDLPGTKGAVRVSTPSGATGTAIPLPPSGSGQPGDWWSVHWDSGGGCSDSYRPFSLAGWVRL